MYFGDLKIQYICNLNICILVILRYNISNLNILRIHISYFHGHNSFD